MAFIVLLLSALFASDAAIEQAIRAKFAKSKISAEKFTVHVQGGVAVIEGSTNVVQRKGVATRLAKTGGAKAVDNRIRIGEAARAAAAARLAEHRKRPGAHPTAKPSARTDPPPARQKPVTQTAAKQAEAPAPPAPQPIRRARVKH